MTQPSRRFRTGRTAAVVIAAVMLLPTSLAYADPDVTDDDVRAAQQAVTDASGSVAAMEVRLAQLSSENDAAQLAVQQAAEDYAQALADLDTAKEAAQQAADQCAAAQEELESARSTLVAIAREAARNGGSMDTVQALLSADGFEDVVARSQALGLVSGKADQAVQNYRAADQVATTLKLQADAAQSAEQSAATTAETTLSDAQTAQKTAEEAVSQAATERQSLIVRLAAVRNTSTEVEQQRQDQLDADRVAQAEAAAQQERTAEPAPSTPATPAPTNPTPTNPTPTTPTPSTPAPVDPTPVVPPGGGSSSGSTAAAEVAIAWAKQQLGKPYAWGGNGPNSYDCSGLTRGAWAAAGVNLNRTSSSQYTQVKKISYNDLRPGDLVFWGRNANDASSVTHVAMYLGDGQIIEAPKPGDVVKISSMRWTNSMAYAGRP